MQDQNITTADQDREATEVAEQMVAQAEKVVPGMAGENDILGRVIEKIRESENILVTLSRDPSVDEMAGALALTMFLDGLQKHTTAIYSGKTPDALKFLQPEGTFESNTASLQDFIIALSKEKADHLRYKLEGDFVKIYITPYKTTLSEADLEFSHGDYNVDLVLALSVPSVADLDAALAEYGRIMHDATTVDITCEAPGKFGEIEWSDPGASSVSEMLTRLIFRMQGEEVELDKGIANALLTGIVAATGRFSNERTNSETMQLASRLMAMGADQQMIAMHVIDSEAEEKAAEAAAKEAEEKAAQEAAKEAEERAAVKAAEAAKGTTVEVDEKALEQVKARATMEAAAEAALNRAVKTAADNAAAVSGAEVAAAPEVSAAPGATVAVSGVPVGQGSGVAASVSAPVTAPVVAQTPVSAPVATPVTTENPVLPAVAVAPATASVAAPAVATAPVTAAPVSAPATVPAPAPAPTVAPAPTSTLTVAPVPVSAPAPTVAPVPTSTPTVATMQVPGTVELPKVEPVAVPVSAPMTGVAELPKVEPVATTAPAVGATLQPAPTIEPVAKPKDYEAMIEQALAEPLPVETAASAAGLLKTPVGVPAASATTPVAPAASTTTLVAPAVGVPAGVNPAVMAAPQEAAETAAPILGPMGLAMPSEVRVQPAMAPSTVGAQPGVMPPVGAGEVKPGQTILPPAPTPEVGTGLMPPTV